MPGSLKTSQFLLDDVLIATFRFGLFKKLDGAEESLGGMNVLDGCLLGGLQEDRPEAGGQHHVVGTGEQAARNHLAQVAKVTHQLIIISSLTCLTPSSRTPTSID